MSENKSKGKGLVGRIVKLDDAEYVVTEYLGGFDVTGCPIRNGRVFWRSRRFLGSEWTPTTKKPVNVPVNEPKIDQVPERYSIKLENAHFL